MTTRRKYVKYGLIGLTATITLLLVWGIGIEPRLFEVREETAAIPHLPRAWEGKRIALIADFQVGMWMGNTDTVRRIVAFLIAERPAIVLIAGDFVYRPTDDDESDDIEREDVFEFREEINEAVALIPRCRKPVFYVMPYSEITTMG